MDKLKEQLFAALQRFYPGTDDEWEFDAEHKRLIAKAGTLRQMANGNSQTIQYSPDEEFEHNRFQRAYAHVSELSDFQRWVHEAMHSSRDVYEAPYNKTWANIGVLTIDRDTSDPIEISNRICAEKLLSEFKSWTENDYDLSRQVHWGPGWISTIGIQMLDDEGNPTELARFCWEKLVKPLGIDEVQILDDQLYYAVQYYYDLDQIESCLKYKVKREDPKRYPDLWEEINEEYPAITWQNGWREYPLWVFDVFKTLCSHPDGAAGDNGSYRWEQIEEVAREKGLIE